MNAKYLCVTIFCVGTLGSTSRPAHALGGSALDFRKLVSDSPIICAGTLSNASLVGITAETGERSNYFVSDCIVDRCIKGDISNGIVRVRLFGVGNLNVPTARFNLAYAGKRYLLFLNSDSAKDWTFKMAGVSGDKQDIVFTDTIVPLGPAGASDIDQGRAPEQMIEAELIGAAESSDLQIALNALSKLWLWNRKSTKVSQVIEDISQSNKPQLSAYAIAMRIGLGDASAIPLALKCPNLGEIESDRIGSALENVDNPEAIGELVEIFRAKNGALKRGALCALSKLANSREKHRLQPVFHQALDDSDRDVQYQAIKGLFRLRYNPDPTTGQIILSSGQKLFPILPTYDAFMNEPQKYVEMWKSAD